MARNRRSALAVAALAAMSAVQPAVANTCGSNIRHIVFGCAARCTPVLSPLRACRVPTPAMAWTSHACRRRRRPCRRGDSLTVGAVGCAAKKRGRTPSRTSCVTLSRTSTSIATRRRRLSRATVMTSTSKSRFPRAACQQARRAHVACAALSRFATPSQSVTPPSSSRALHLRAVVVQRIPLATAACSVFWYERNLGGPLEHGALPGCLTHRARVQDPIWRRFRLCQGRQALRPVRWRLPERRRSPDI